MKTVNTFVSHWKSALFLLFCILTMLPGSMLAGAFGSSVIALGTRALLRDVSTWLLILAPIVGGLSIIYFFIRRSVADEMDQKKWNNRVVTALISTVAAVISSTILNLLTSYFIPSPPPIP